MEFLAPHDEPLIVLLLTPVATGLGQHMFDEIHDAPHLSLADVRRFADGVLVLVLHATPPAGSDQACLTPRPSPSRLQVICSAPSQRQPWLLPNGHWPDSSLGYGMIVSRVAELRTLDDLLAALICGEGGALIVHGEAGIGKTTLLQALAERARGAVTVVRACGAETEAELAFAALTDLLSPLLRHLDALPVAQAAVLMGALALEPPTPGDRLAALHDHHITQTVVVPPIVHALARHPAVDHYDLSSLQWLGCGAAPLGAELQLACAQRIGCRSGRATG